MLLKDFSKETFDIIIQAGQSNSEGYAFGAVEKAYKHDDRVWYLTGDWRVPRDFYFKPGDRLYVRMMAMIQTALELNPQNRLVALLWHQGETDAVFHASYDVHYNHLADFIRTVRGTLELPELPFVAGDFTKQWSEENKETVIPVVHAIRSVCKDIGMAAFVESSGLLSNAQDTENNPNTDSIHFCRQAIYELGDRYYDAFVQLTT